MIQSLAQGFLLGLAYVAPIGMQNSYVIQSAATLSRGRAYQVALITTFFDLTLAVACYLGVGTLIETFPGARLALLGFGSLAVVWIGTGLVRSSPQALEGADVSKPLSRIALTCFVVTWLNPQALIDGTMFVGGFRASMPAEQALNVFMGVCLASMVWFCGITTLVIRGKKHFTPRVQKGINVVCGSVVILYGLSLAWTLIKEGVL